MPLQIIRQDITKMQVDAIVNPSNRHLEPTGGADLAIHEAAGPELYKECRKLGGCAVGSAEITPGFNLPCKYVIHTAGPDWYRENDPERLLISCYRSCLEIAKNNGCETIAFPLISAGLYGYPKDQVLKIAINTISSFLFNNEMMIYLLVFDKTSYELSKKLFSDVESYIDDNFERKHSIIRRRDSLAIRKAQDYTAPRALPRMAESDSTEAAFCLSTAYEANTCPENDKNDVNSIIELDERFALRLMKLIDTKGITDVECYKKANVSKQTWHKIITDESYKPNKKTAISFAIALELNLSETQKLLESVGFILSSSLKFDVLIKYCIEKEIYNVFEIDSLLFKYDQETLFSKA